MSGPHVQANEHARPGNAPGAWLAIAGPALAGALGWGIRGQYGHETGAMIAGLLVSLVLVFLFCPHFDPLSAARAVAFGTLAVGFGGSETYGQTIGLTQNPAMVGNGEALRWGLLGLAIKGGVWIGFAGAFLGLGLSHRSCRPRELLPLLATLLAAFFIGVALLNSPFDPARKILPPIYFSADWRWEPGADLKPRPEVWGGLLFAWVVLLLYLGLWRRDRLARNLGLWAFLGGAVGFPLGQGLQAYHAWNPDCLTQMFLAPLNPFMNWWNWMETTFGLVWGALLGAGLWLNRRHLHPGPSEPPTHFPAGLEATLAVLHLTLLVGPASLSEPYQELGLALGLIPLVAVAGGRWWPFFIAPLTALPIILKTFAKVVADTQELAPAPGAVLLVILPLLALGAVSWGLSCAQHARALFRIRLALSLLLATWMFFGLNLAFVEFPLPWRPWTARTPNSLAFLVCALGLTAVTLVGMRRVPGMTLAVHRAPG